MTSLSTTLSLFRDLLAGDPALFALESAMAAVGAVLVFLILYTLRDILLRTQSFLYQIGCILLVAALPIVGFLLYLLVRPARTVREREVEAMLKLLLERQQAAHAQQIVKKKVHPPHHTPAPPTFKMSPKIEA